MNVRIVEEITDCVDGDEDFVRVRAHLDPADDTVTLATIERVVERCAEEGPIDDDSTQWHVRTLILDQPMTFDAALGLATRYAERKGIPVVYAEPNGGA